MNIQQQNWPINSYKQKHINNKWTEMHCQCPPSFRWQQLLLISDDRSFVLN